MNVLSLFDGMSCGQIALNRCGIKYKKYFASEIDKYAMKVTMKNFPGTIQLGDIRKIKVKNLPKIDLLIGGSPCQGFSFAGKQLNFEDERSKLFFEYVRLLKECKPKYFLLENVRMDKQSENIITQTLGVLPIQINSALVSAQERKRLYWTNIGLESMGLFDCKMSVIKQPKDKGLLLKDILETEVPEIYFLSEKMLNYFLENNFLSGKRQIGSLYENKAQAGRIYSTEGKSICLNSQSGGIGAKTGLYQINTSKESGGKQPYQQNRIYRSNGEFPALMNSLAYGSNLIQNKTDIRRLTPVECERLQTIPDNYTTGVSDSQRYKMLGNGWTIDVICHIFNYMEK